MDVKYRKRVPFLFPKTDIVIRINTLSALFFATDFGFKTILTYGPDKKLNFFILNPTANSDTPSSPKFGYQNSGLTDFRTFLRIGRVSPRRY